MKGPRACRASPQALEGAGETDVRVVAHHMRKALGVPERPEGGGAVGGVARGDGGAPPDAAAEKEVAVAVGAGSPAHLAHDVRAERRGARDEVIRREGQKRERGG